MYKCNFHKMIYRDYKEKVPGCYVETNAQIPFAPFIGLKIFVADRVLPEEIIGVTYDVSGNSFICEVRADSPAVTNSYEGFRESYLNFGWTTKGDL